MQKVNLPDGRTLNIPNDLDPAKREELANAVKSEYNIDINEASLGEWLVDKPISVARGLSQMIPTGVKGIAGLVAGSDSDIVKNLSDYQNYVATESALSSNPKFRGTFGTKLAEGAGSLIGFGGAAFAGRKLASKGIVSDKVGRFGVPGAFAVPMGMGEQVSLLEESRALGEQPNAIAEKLAILTGGVIGMSELAPIERLFRSIPKNALKNPTVQELLTTRLKSAAATGTAEAFQEATAGIAQNLTAAGLYSDELPIFDSALEEFTIGGILGATADLLINSIGNRRSISSQRLKDAEAKARENRTSLQSEDKFNRAQGQETVEEFQQPIIKEKPDIPVPPIVDVAPPDLDVIQNPDGQFSVIDYNNVEQPIVSSHADETKALLAKNNAQTNYERKVLQVQVDNDTYIIGMPDSDSAKTLGRTILDPNLSQINLSTLIGYDSTLSEDFKKELNEEKSATYPGKPFRQILENKRAKLEKTSKYLESKGLELKSSFSMPEIKKVLNKKDYNDLLTSFANHAFAESEKAGEPSIRADVDQVDVTIKNIKAIADAKNIELNFKDPAVRYAAQQWTGFEDIPKTRNRGAKELFLARIHSLPAFNTKTKFPDFRPRTYTGLDMANFVASAQNIEFSKKDLIEVGPESIRNNQESTDQFFNDLIDSGRAVKVEGKNKYKITDDFEYTVARRQEGFGETPDQFGSRLKADQATGKNKLSDEAIENLIRSEEVRQEKVLPPKQLEAKLIDFKETVEEGRTNKFARELKNKLNKAGLGDVGVVVSDDILSTTTLAETESGEIIFDPRVTRPSTTQGAVEGEYDKNTDIIFLSLNAINPDGTATDEQILQRLDRVMDHEMIHAFRAKDLITEKEYQYLRNQVKSRKVPKEYDESSKGETFYTRSQRINAQTAAEATSRGASKELIEELYVEEAIAEMYRAREFKDITPKAETILEKIVEFFKSMGTAMRVSGYADSSEIFADIESGKVGARQRGEIRTLRELDRISIAREQGILGGLDAPPSAVPDDTEIVTPEEPSNVTDLPEGVLVTPVTTFEDVEADTDPITGVSLTLGSKQRGGLYDQYSLTKEELLADAVEIKSKFNGNEDASSIDILDWLAKNGPSQDYRVIAQRLSTQLKKIKRIKKVNFYTRIVGKKQGKWTRLERHKGATMPYLGVSYGLPFQHEGELRQQIYIRDKNPNVEEDGVTYNTLLHELVHQTTQAAYYSSQDQTTKEAFAQLEKIREKLENERRKSGNTDFYTKYGLTNVQELLAVGLTDRKFQKFMEETKFTPNSKKTLWDKFTESLRKILQIPAKVDSAFSEFLLNAGKVTNLSTEQIKGIVIDGTSGRDIADYSRQNLQSELSSLQTQLYNAESLENADRRYVGTTKGNRNAKKIQDIRNRIADVEQQLAQPIDPEQLPLFSRAATDTKPPYMDFNRKQIRNFSSNKVGFYDGVEIPLTHVARMRVEDFLKLTTVNQKVINNIITGGPTVALSSEPMGLLPASIRNPDAIFDPEIADTAIIPSLPNLEIRGNGQVISHEGRHRVALIGQGGGRTVPVFINFPEGNVEQNIPNPSGQTLQEQGVTFLRNQEFNNFTVPINRLGEIAPLHRDSAQTKDKLDYAVEVASQPDLLAPSENIPLFSRSQRFTGEANTSEKIALQKATETVEEFTRKTPRGEVPLYNLNASDVALKAAYDYINDPSAPTIDELPNYSRVEKEIPDDLKGVVNKGGYVPARRPWYDRFIDEVKDPRTNIRKFFKDTRQNYIDKLDKAEKLILRKSEEFEEVRLLNNTADTSAIAALRQADKARGIFQGMLTRGFAIDTIEGEAALTSTEELEIDTRYNPFIEGNTGKGGLLQITAPLFSDPTIDLEGIFGTYAKLKRVQQFQAEGRQVESPFTQQDLEFINNIEANYPVVVEVYNNYQKWNNKLVDFAQAKGLLNQEQADEWRAKSTYYPFYRDMVEEEGITAPRIGGGSLPNNPLNIKLVGKDKPIDVAPLEAIARNSLSILTASMKNDGMMKLIKTLEIAGEAEVITDPKQASNNNTIFVFENGLKKRFTILDPDLFHGIRALGGAEVGFITKMLAFPATILRDTVTRDPGFIAVNLLRDTLSATVTSGVNLSAGEDGFTPMVDTIKNMFADMTDLEKFGVIGGYDFANDEGDVVDYLARTRRQQGLSNDNGISAQDAFYKLWDGLGGLTTKSDGATRKGVFDAVYKKLKKDGYTEAQAQSEAAYQALEIINFGRRGLSPMFRVITSAIPFLNARIQGLDVIYRSSFGGTYSAQDKLQEGETLDQLKNRIFKRTALRGGMIMASTMIYYLLVSDTDEYKEAKREVRDDNWLVPTPFDYTIKIPIPFEVGMMFKALPERFIDLVLGEKVLGVKESVEKDPFESVRRQLGTSANIPILGGDISLQAIKPLFEAITNRNSFTNSEIVPYYKLKREAGYQSSPQTNELARLIGEAINVSPTKIEHVLNGYTGTLGGYVLDIVDSLTRTATGSPFIPNNIFSNPTNFAQYPLIKRLVIDDKKMGGYQQQFYELRGEVDSAVQTLNSLRKQKRFDELAAYKSDVKGLIKVKGKVRALERYLSNWRNKRDRLMRRTDISVIVKAELLQDLEMERDKRLAFVPELRKKANVPILQGGL